MGVSTPDDTHDPALKSWIDSANDSATDFPPQNLPLGAFLHGGEAPRIGAAIGDAILDLTACARRGLLHAVDVAVRDALRGRSLNALLALGRGEGARLRRALSKIVRVDTDEGSSARRLEAEILIPMRECTMILPADIGDFTDFYASVHHATNVGKLFRPENPLLPNYKWLPVAYHGRSSSIVPSGTAIRRPCGQSRGEKDSAPQYGPSRALDYEVELGALVCGSNAMGEAVPLATAETRLFGLTLVNDWSARDIQSWEYQPLGPFLAKNFATTISPWIVMLDACAPFRRPRAARAKGDPPLLAHLDDAHDRDAGGVDVTLEVSIRTTRIRNEGGAPVRLSRGSFADMYWTLGQMVAHHTSNGCNMRPGDLIASGTVSGPKPESRGCLLELTKKGAEPVTLPNGETRTYLTEGDEVIVRGWCEREGYRRIGFGECAGTIA